MNLSLWLWRVLAGALLGVLVVLFLINLRVDGWLTLGAGSIVMSALVATMHVAVSSKHYKTWKSRSNDSVHSATEYVLLQALFGFPLVAVASFLTFAGAFALLVAP